MEFNFIRNQEQLKDEVKKRMELLRLDKKIIDDYLDNHKIWTSADVLRPATPEELEHVRNFELPFGDSIYHIIHADFMGCDVINMLSVSPYLEDWEYEQGLIISGAAMSRSDNITRPDWSESGTIYIRNESGVLKRWG